MSRKNSDECIEGGVVHNYCDANAPRKIESTELIRFHCVFSLLSLVDTGFLGNRVYTLDAYLENGIVKGYLNWHCGGEGEKTTFETELSFMNKLHKIVDEYDLAKHNGYVRTVSGLPEMYGAKLDIGYAGGEYIYAHNNQDCFLSMEMMEETVKLFMGVCKK